MFESLKIKRVTNKFEISGTKFISLTSNDCFDSPEDLCLRLVSSSFSDELDGSTSHHGDVGSPSEAVWNEEALEGGVPVHSEAVMKSSSDLLLPSGDVLVVDDLAVVHSCKWSCKIKSIDKT